MRERPGQKNIARREMAIITPKGVLRGAHRESRPRPGRDDDVTRGDARGEAS